MSNKFQIIVVILLTAILTMNPVNAFSAPTSAPSAPTLSYTPMAPTNGNVTVTIYYPTTAVLKQYKLGVNGSWVTYSAPFVISSNTYICAQYQDKSGNWSTQGGVTISNIDKTPPVNPVINVSSTVMTNQNVTVSITYSQDSVTRQYKTGSSGTWTNYTAPIILSSNDVVYAKASDSAGNWTPSVSCCVTNIDKTAPSIPIITEDISSPTNIDVNVSITYPSDADVKQFKISDNGNWIDYTSSLDISANTSVYARAQDAAGNWSDTGTLTVSNIDRTPPADPTFMSSISSLTNQDVSVSINYSLDSLIKQYKIGNSGIWTDYSSPVIICSNGTIYAKSSDNAGNWASEVCYAVTNIDKIPPQDPVFTPSTTSITNQNVPVAINFSSDSVILQYMIGDSGAWMDYTTPVSVDSNCTLYSRACDSAGNWSSTTSYTVSNIDKTPPSDPVFTASTTSVTNQNVTIGINFSSDSVIMQYKLGDSGSWTDYISSIPIDSNCTMYSRACDSAGNWSSITSCTVSNIDKTPPVNPLFSSSTTAPTNQSVNLTISYSDDSIIRQYRISSTGNWVDYTLPIVLSKNSAIYAKACDSAGNWTPEVCYQVNNIVKTVLGYTIKYNSADVSSYNSMVANSSTLNEIATATYNIDGYGNLTGNAPTDQINYANSSGIRSNLMISNNFDANIAKQMLESTTNRQNLITSIISVLRTYNYKGVNVDIENIPAADRDCYTALINGIFTSLKPLGYEVSVAVPAKTYDSPNAPWNYAYDYQSLAACSDYLMIMAYDEHYPGGTPGAIASIGFVTSVVNYATTVIPKDKIVLGLAAYGYDWSSSMTKSYSINGCISLAKQYGATIYFDSITDSKYFNYTANGVTHTVWFEDGDTIAYKLDLVNSMGLKGIGIWRLGLENSNYWSTITAKMN